MKKKYLILAFASLISGCAASAPSESDIRRNIKKSFESCDIFNIKEVKKINGRESEYDHIYLVDFDFTIHFDGIEGGREANEALVSALNEEQSARSKRVQARYELDDLKTELQIKLDREVDNLINNSSSGMRSYSHLNENEMLEIEKIKEKYSSIYDQEYEKYQNIEQSSGLSKSHIDELRKNLQEKQREFSKNCKINNKFAMNVFLLKGIDTNTAYLGGTYNVSFKNFKMEKTENGWIFKY